MDTAFEQAKTLMTPKKGSAISKPVAVMEEKLGEETQVQKLAQQIVMLTEQVAMLTVNDKRRVRSFLLWTVRTG